MEEKPVSDVSMRFFINCVRVTEFKDGDLGTLEKSRAKR
jgi:hypothetical protein